MSLSRRQFTASLAGATALPASALAQSKPPDLAEALLSVLSRNPLRAQEGIGLVRQYGKLDIAPGLIPAVRFASHGRRDAVRFLEELTGESHGESWFEWMLWQERNPQIVPHRSYAKFKRDLFLQIDPNFDDFLKLEYLARDRMKIRLEEIAWGGVVKDGIPSLDNPKMVPAGEAGYLRDDDLVFGVRINDDARAYPLRIMGWHEMFNDTIGGVPLALAYCTLCGAGILFETDVPNMPRPIVFGSSGFLYRSNKLMFDRGTHSLWNQFTGEPVVGPLVNSGIVLKQRPVVIATWANWKAANSRTRVLSLDTGHRRDYGSGVVYQSYFASDDLMFPALVDQSDLRQKDYVFGIRTTGASKAWPLEAFGPEPVINDRVGDLNVVLLGDPDGRSVRAYDRGSRRFDPGLRSDGAQWKATEDALIGPGGEKAVRVAGHISYWFAWDGYLGAQSELYGR